MRRVNGTQSTEETTRGWNDWINLSLDSVIQSSKIPKGNDVSILLNIEPTNLTSAFQMSTIL